MTPTTAKRCADPGMKHHRNMVKNNVYSGAAIKIAALELDVGNSSFETSLIPSAMGCDIPNIPFSFGPRRR